MPTKKRKRLSGTDQAAYLKALATCAPALCEGYRSIITTHLPGYAKRLAPWGRRLEVEHTLRVSRDGETAAKSWLLAEVRNPRLPDLRKGKSLSDDPALVRRYENLKVDLKPVFRQFRQNTSRRNQAAAPIVSRILGRNVTPDWSWVTGNLTEFCMERLKTNAVRLSRARRRLSQQAAQHVHTAMQLLQSVASSKEAPEIAARAREALSKLDPVLRSYANRKLR